MTVDGWMASFPRLLRWAFKGSAVINGDRCSTRNLALAAEFGNGWRRDRYRRLMAMLIGP